MPSKLVYVGSKRTEPNLSDATFNQWYVQEHIPDIMKSGSLELAGWYHAVNKDATSQFLGLYDCYDLEFIHDKTKLDAIPKVHPLLGEGKKVWDVASFDMRQYDFDTIDDAERPGKVSLYPRMIIVEFEPVEGCESSVDDWYRKEHFEIFSKLPGYTRSRRCNILPTSPNKLAARYIAFHEYERTMDPINQEKQSTWFESQNYHVVVRDVNIYQLQAEFRE